MKKLAKFANYLKTIIRSKPNCVDAPKENIQTNFSKKIQFLSIKNISFDPEYLSRFFQKNQEYKKREEDKQNFNFSQSSISQGINFPKLYSLFGLLAIIIYKKISCYPANDKEIEKVRNNLENQIKSLEFKYQGKLRRQPVK
jgi:hypothetical protein